MYRIPKNNAIPTLIWFANIWTRHIYWEQTQQETPQQNKNTGIIPSLLIDKMHVLHSSRHRTKSITASYRAALFGLWGCRKGGLEKKQVHLETSDWILMVTPRGENVAGQVSAKIKNKGTREQGIKNKGNI